MVVVVERSRRIIDTTTLYNNNNNNMRYNKVEECSSIHLLYANIIVVECLGGSTIPMQSE